ncbi:MAG: cytochrome c [Bacteroidota bacterium]|nr:cytochrome c [Bacteroidota bacterium]
MKKALKIVGFIVGGLLLVIIGLVAYLNFFFPKVAPAPAMTINATPEMVERGKYLANHVSVCMDCHSERDFTKFSGPLMPGTLGRGGDKFDREGAGIPGTFYARNITPTNLKNWTDGEIYRMITTGVRKNGEPVFPLMPYLAYGKMDPQDVKSIIAYLRTLTPLEGSYPDAQFDFPMNLIVRTIPKDATPSVLPDPKDTVKYGEYLVMIGACADCHTPMEKGEPLPGMRLAGGFEFKFPNGNVVRSANLTPSHETGIGLWTEEVFLGRFYTYRDSAGRNKAVTPDEFNSVMPWTMYAGMTDGDLKSIYRYLTTVDPVEHKVEKFTVHK